MDKDAEDLEIINRKLKDLKQEGKKGLVTLFIPTRDLHKVLELHSMEKSEVKFTQLSLSSPIDAQTEKIETNIIGCNLYKRTFGNQVSGHAFLHRPELQTFHHIIYLAQLHNLHVNIKRLILKIDGQEWVFKLKIPPKESLLRSASEKVPFQKHTGSVLDLQNCHDVITLLKLRKSIQNSRIRLCEVKPKTVKEGVCLSIISNEVAKK